MSEERIPKRSEVPEESKWALEDIYPTDEMWSEDLQKLKAMPERYCHSRAGSAKALICSMTL